MSLANKLITAAAASQTNYSYIYVGAVSGLPSDGSAPVHNVTKAFQGTVNGSPTKVDNFNGTIRVQQDTGQWIGVDPATKQLYVAGINGASYLTSIWLPVLCAYRPGEASPYMSKSLTAGSYWDGAVDGPIMFNSKYVFYQSFDFSLGQRGVHIYNYPSITFNTVKSLVTGTRTFTSLATAVSRDGTRLYTIYCSDTTADKAANNTYINVYDMMSSSVSAIITAQKLPTLPITPGQTPGDAIAYICPQPTDNNILYLCFRTPGQYVRYNTSTNLTSSYSVSGNPITGNYYAGNRMVIDPTGTTGWITTWNTSKTYNLVQKFSLPNSFIANNVFSTNYIIYDIALSNSGKYLYVGASTKQLLNIPCALVPYRVNNTGADSLLSPSLNIPALSCTMIATSF